MYIVHNLFRSGQRKSNLMSLNNGITIVKNPSKEILTESPINFLLSQNKSFWIKVDGEDQSRCRVITTLLHGNEPSGIQAIHKLLSDGIKPAVNLYFFIGAVESAIIEPYFDNRYLPNGQDLNRCFRNDVDNDGGLLAKQVLNFIGMLQPEAVIDLHNTTSPGESFAIAVKNTAKHQYLASLFTNKLVINHFSLGAIMEHDSTKCPIMTIECGGHNDPESVKTAYLGIENFACIENLWQAMAHTSEPLIQIYDKPFRLEYIDEGNISFGVEPNTQAALTILNNYSNQNFKHIKKGQLFAFANKNNINTFKAVVDNTHSNHVSHFFMVDDGKLIVKKDITIFMLTTNPYISKNDCICYFVE